MAPWPYLVLILVPDLAMLGCLAVALIWCAHIGMMDHMIGYGLRYPTAFANTHRGVVGRRTGDD